jgi:[ribosomal protein S18]-alanine N-acetyltransferase
MIRRAASADTPALAALEAVFPTDRMSARNFQDLLRRGRGSVLVYEVSGALLGDAVVLYRRNSSTARIYSLVVEPAQRGRGIARQLLAAVEAEARERHCRILRLEVRPDNAQALRLYAHLGYTVEKRLEQFYEDGSPALRLRKIL